MELINIEKILVSKVPSLETKFPKFIKNSIVIVLEKILMLKKINQFISKYNEKYGIEFIDEFFETFDISYKLSQRDREKIPSEGKVIVVANHPFGGLDGLILLKLLLSVRNDVKVVVNDVLLNINNLKDHFLPLDLFSTTKLKENYQAIAKALNEESALIIFPAGEVSRLKLNGIKDTKWKKGVVYFAEKFQAPVLPIHIKGRNSLLFYLASLISKKFSMFLLPYELMNKEKKTIELKIGNLISPKALSTKYFNIDHLTKSLRKHLYRIGNNKPGIFETESTVIQPVDKQKIKMQLNNSEFIGQTNDGKKIYLVNYSNAQDVIREIARLREITFRKVGEGTGRNKDFDTFDKHYKHLVLWDDDNLEIVGAYRFAFGNEVMLNQGVSGFYTSTLFDFSDSFLNLLPNAIELGRSFIQSRYWNSMALDYLWQGIGKVLLKNQQIRYLFGPVSMSNNYSEEAKNLIVYFFSKWFSKNDDLVLPKNKFEISERKVEELKDLFCLDDYDQEIKILKSQLKILGFSIPVLFKQYSDICYRDGVNFVDFSIDPDFNNCVDAFIILDLNYIKETKRARYLKTVENSKELIV
jgi:putative hemolysin